MISQSERELLIAVAEEFQQEVSEAWLQHVLAIGLRHALGADEPCQVSLWLTDDAAVQELNREYRGLDEITDVLSFSATHQGHWEGEGAPTIGPDAVLGLEGEESFPAFVLPPDELPPLGEVVISYPQTCRQAAAAGKETHQELALLVVHGTLHLVGHDHLEPDETRAMRALEQAALADIFANAEVEP